MPAPLHVAFHAKATCASSVSLPICLQDLICAGMHSRAAYGFPAAAGMMSTVTDYIKLQTIQPLT